MITTKQNITEAIANGSKLTKADAGRVINNEKKQLKNAKKQATK